MTQIGQETYNEAVADSERKEKCKNRVELHQRGDVLQFNVRYGANFSEAAFQILLPSVFREAPNVNFVRLEEIAHLTPVARPNKEA